MIDSLISNSNPFRIQALYNTPPGSIGYLDLILRDNTSVIDTVRIKVIIGKRDYFIWDPDRNNSSGPVIHSILQDLGYIGDYTGAQFYSFDHLKNYKLLFICTGVAYENYVLFRDCNEVKKVVDFINQGGNVYLEGGECWAFDPFAMFGFNFNPYFGIKPINDGYTNMGPIEGEPNTFTDHMLFRYDGENFYLDVIDSTGTGFRIFHDQDDDYYCGVANIGDGYRTVGVSFELSGLVDNEPYTKARLLDSIMHFFGINLVGIEDLRNSQSVSQSALLLSTHPNPFGDHCMIKYQIPTEVASSQYSVASIKIFDISGRLVRSFPLTTGHCLLNTLVWFGDDDRGRRLPSGVYLVQLELGDFRQTKKAVLLR